MGRASSRPALRIENGSALEDSTVYFVWGSVHVASARTKLRWVTTASPEEEQVRTLCWMQDSTRASVLSHLNVVLGQATSACAPMHGPRCIPRSSAGERRGRSVLDTT